MAPRKSTNERSQKSQRSSQARKNMQTLETITKPERRNTKMESSSELKSSRQSKRKSK